MGPKGADIRHPSSVPRGVSARSASSALGQQAVERLLREIRGHCVQRRDQPAGSTRATYPPARCSAMQGVDGTEIFALPVER